ncbi:uncharacterized protein LOC123533669 isoform X2 [Mercenaria mercenaria]|uniref:uncharacterized protein LOC123533669 isoform X2 n=1 Tax=Mercenaria mercenaria TaxID=6596 RepID=UPI00234E9956|nr:uncharacterized protein LOC123533669 isoform X2 [Mercenaria mercenaria]
MMMTIKVFVCISFLWAAVHIREGNALVEPLEYLPQDLQDNLNICQGSGDLTQQSARTVFWTSINQFCSKFVHSRPDLTPRQAAYLTNSLQDAFAPFYPNTNGRVKRQAALAPRTRQEIRTLSDRQRRSFFAAVNAMKRNTLLPPNVYDFLADYHRGNNLRAAHVGPAFASWHRLYLWIFEYFLRREDPAATLPYWASMFDNGIDFRESVLWHETFLGNGDGQPRNGPFRDWPQLTPGRVFTRNVQNLELYTWDGIARILNQIRNANISFPTAPADSNLESQHGGPHIAIGGSMSSLDFATRDPSFFLHHAFVDALWWWFRRNQTRNGINPETDYPYNANDPRFRREHAPDYNAGFAGLSGASTWRQRLGFLNELDRLVRYRPIPECPCGNSRYLRCDDRTNRCRAITIAELETANLLSSSARTAGRKKRAPTFSIPLPQDTSFDVCPRRSYLNDIDTRRLGWSEPMSNKNSEEWSYISVKVVAKRAMEYHEFDKYSLYNQGRNAQFGQKDELFRPGIQKRYQNCEKNQDAVGKITIVSHGLNYHGYAEEYAILDNRLGVSEAKAVIPVKMPTASHPTEAIIAAFDSCGRACKPYLKKGTTGAMFTDSHFTGGIRVSRTAPQQYANSYKDALLKMWDVPSQSSCPNVNYDSIPLSFFCEYTDTWIWGSANTMPGGGHGMVDQGQGSHMRPWQGSQTGLGQGSNTGWQGVHSRPGQEPDVGRGQGSLTGSGIDIGRMPPLRRGGRVTGGRRRHGDRTYSHDRVRPRRPSHRSGIPPFRGSSRSTSLSRDSSRSTSPSRGSSGSILPLPGRYSGRTVRSRAVWV